MMPALLLLAGSAFMAGVVATAFAFLAPRMWWPVMYLFAGAILFLAVRAGDAAESIADGARSGRGS